MDLKRVLPAPPALSMVVLIALTVQLSGQLLAIQYGPWSTPVNLDIPINSPYSETLPRLSKHGLSLYFTSDRPCDPGDMVPDNNIWVARRNSEDEPWQQPQYLAINRDARVAGTSLATYWDREAELSRDEHWLYVASDRPGSLGTSGLQGLDIWVSWRPNVHDDQGWTEPFNPGAPLNSSMRDGAPAYFENDETGGYPRLFFDSNRGNNFDIWVADIVANGLPVAAVNPVNEVNSAGLDAAPSIRHDGLELFFFRQSQGVVADIYSATRPSPFASWSQPINLGAPVNSADVENTPRLSPDGESLLFASNRSGSVAGPNGLPSLDIWMSTRTRAKKP